MHEKTNIFVQGSMEIRKIIALLDATSKRRKTTGEHYRLNRLDGSSYLDSFPKWQWEITSYLSELRAKGEEPVYVDICGRADGFTLGAVKCYSFSLQPVPNYFLPSEHRVMVSGNIFSGKDFNSFIQLLRKNGSRPAFVTFEPVAGLQYYTPDVANGLFERIVYQRLEGNLRRMYDLLLPGGFIYISRPFQLDDMREFFAGVPQEKSALALRIQSFCQNRRCSLQINRTIFGPRFLIRKHLERKKRTG